MVKHKQGISAVVAVVLTILITIAGVGVIWGAILPMITEGSSFSDLDVQLNVVKSGGYTFWDEDAGRLYVQVSRGVDEVNMTGVKFIVSVGGTTVTYPDQALFPNGAFDVPGVNGKRSYILNVSEEPDSIKAIALVVVGNSEKEFSATGELKGIPMSSASDNTGELSVIRSGDSGITGGVVRDWTPRSCSEAWGASCEGADPYLGDYSFDDCAVLAYYGSGYWVDEVYVNATSVALGDTVKITCDFDCYYSSGYNDFAISYYNGESWKNVNRTIHSCYDGEYSVDVVVDGNPGQQYARCSIGRYDYVDYYASSDTCFNSPYADNDDVDFTVV